MNAPPRPGRKPWLGVLVSMLAICALVLAAVPADSATGAPPAVRTVSTLRAPGKVSAATCNVYRSSLRPSGPPDVTVGSYMETILRRGFLVAGVDQNTYPYGFWSPLDQKLEGFDIAMVQAVAYAIFGNRPNDVRYVGISDEQRKPDLINQTVDIVAHTMTIKCSRLKYAAFSTVYFDTSQRVLVPKNSPARSLGDLRGQKVCATAGSDSLGPIAAAGDIPVAVPYWTDCLVLLQQGDVAAISTDAGILDGLQAQDPETKVVGPSLGDQPYGLAMSRQYPEFVQFVNAVLVQMFNDGQWEASYKRWISPSGATPPRPEYRD